jgi:hypothetical protein
MAKGNESLLKASSDQRIERFHDSTLTGINDRSRASHSPRLPNLGQFRSARPAVTELAPANTAILHCEAIFVADSRSASHAGRRRNDLTKFGGLNRHFERLKSLYGVAAVRCS